MMLWTITCVVLGSAGFFTGVAVGQRWANDDLHCIGHTDAGDPVYRKLSR